MSLHVPCPGCGTTLKAPENRIGKKARCKKCNAAFRIPGPVAADSVGESQLLSAVALPAAPPLPDEEDEEIPMAALAEETETPRPAATPAPLPAARTAFGSAAKAAAIPSTPIPPSKSKSKSKPAAPALPPPPAPPSAPAELDFLSLDEDEPAKGPITTSATSVATVSESNAVTADPFAFSLGHPAPKDEPKSKRRRDRNEDDDEDDRPRNRRRDEKDEEDTRPRDRDGKRPGKKDEEPSHSRYVRPGEQVSGKKPLLLAGILGAIALVAVIAAVIVMTRKDTPPPTTKQEEKKEDPQQAVPAPQDKGNGDKSGGPPTPTPTPTPTPKKDLIEPVKKDQKQNPPKTDAKLPPDPPSGPVVMLELPKTLRTFQIRKPNAKPELAESPSGTSIAVEVPFDKVVRVFAPENRTTQDVIAVWASNPGFNGKGQQFTVDAYSSSTGRRVGRFEYDGDGAAAKCDVSNDVTLFVAAGPDGKLSVWDIAKKTKTLDGFDPYADKPSDKKAGLAAVFFAKTPLHLLTVTTAGVVHVHEILTQKTLATFTPAGPLVPNRVAFGKSVVADDNHSTLVLAAGGVVYQINTAPPLEVVWKQDLKGEVGRSLGIGVAGNPGRVTYLFETDNAKGKKDRAIMFCLPRETPEFYRWQDEAGEPTAVAWAGTDLGVIATAKGVVWAEYDTEAKRFLILAMAEVPGGKAIHTTTERAHWYLVPKPNDPTNSLFVELAMPPGGLIDYRNAAEAKQPIHAVKLDAMGLWR